MKVVNLNIELKDLKGKPVVEREEGGGLVPVVLSKFVATSLVQAPATDPIRQRAIAQKIYDSQGEIELEDADFVMVKKIINDSKASCIVTAELMKILNEAKDE